MNELNPQYIEEEEGMTLQELFKIVWVNKALIFWVTLWVTVFGIIYTYVIVTPKYEANTSIIVALNDQDESSDQTSLSVSLNLIGTYKEFLESNLVLESVLDDLTDLPEDYTLANLQDDVSVKSSTSVLILRISVTNEDPVLATEIANKLVDNAIEIANDTDNGFALLQDKLAKFEEAKVPLNPSSPNKLLNIVISILLGGMLSLGIVFVKELFNNKFQSADEMEKYLGIKVIAAVPGTLKERKLVE
ncbi:MAG: hypothetical protein B6I17_03755 [Tenericutes bacterium 4572_104]|nr:MAG: hypothetical protein B6I17_03755 [Tenericutes bacterium 4572_104]